MRTYYPEELFPRLIDEAADGAPAAGERTVPESAKCLLWTVKRERSREADREG
jgi:hypothetical protein